MKGVTPESFQKSIVELLGTVFPPKQVFAEVTGRSRTSFTTQEAPAGVLHGGWRASFAARPDERQDGRPTWMPVSSDTVVSTPPAVSDRLVSVDEAALFTAQLAIAELRRRIEALEADRAA